MYAYVKKIEIKGLVTKRTFIEVDEQAINQIKSIHENKDVKMIEEVELWIEEVEFLGGLFFDAKDQNEFIHVTRQGIDLLAAEYTIKGVATREFDSKTPVQKLKQSLMHTKESMLQWKFGLDLDYSMVISSVRNLI